MRKLLVLVVPVLAVAVALAASGSAFAAGGDAPRRDGGRGVWFTRVCATPGAALGACGAQVVTNSGGTPLANRAPAPTALGPGQFHSAYGLPTTAPTPQTIAIVDAFDDPNIESDLATFSSFYGLPPCTTANGCFRKVNQAGGTSYPAANAGWVLEIALDVETAHAICQNCKILLVEASSASLANLGAAENRAVTMGANVISNSWGATEYFSETLDQTRYFNHPGVVITASTGDNGYEVQFPAASQYVTAVGGTTLHVNADGSWGSETAWNGTGSGCSVYIAKPSWQMDAGCSGRTVADVSADADPNTGAAVYDSVTYAGQSGWFQVGGTSLAAPLIASVYALTGTASTANYGSAPYASPSLLHDVTSGNNGSCSPSYLCTAGVGFDGPTGLGTPNGLGAFTTKDDERARPRAVARRVACELRRMEHREVRLERGSSAALRPDEHVAHERHVPRVRRDVADREAISRIGAAAEVLHEQLALRRRDTPARRRAARRSAPARIGWLTLPQSMSASDRRLLARGTCRSGERPVCGAVTATNGPMSASWPSPRRTACSIELRAR